jgi:hypothetical protein
MINVSITNKHCSSSYVYHRPSTPIPPLAMKIKFELDTEKASKACLADYASYEAAECRTAKFLCDVIDKVTKT